MRSVKNRIDKVFKNAEVDAILLLNTKTEDGNFLYLTGFDAGAFEGTAMIVTRRELVFFVSALDYEIAKEQRPVEMTVVEIESGEDIKKSMRAHLNGKVVGVNESFLPHASYKRIKNYSGARRLIDVSKAFCEARAIKDEEEIKYMKIANRITKSALSEMKSYLKAGMTEKEIAATIEYFMRKHGADGTAFSSVVSFGKNAALPHHMPDNTKLVPNSFVLMDVGARYKNYCADVTRTLIFKPDKESEKYKRMLMMYKTVEEAQKITLRTMKCGVEASKPHIDAENFINAAHDCAFKGKFIHSLGHSVGIDVHDGRIGLSPNMHFKLREGMVFSDEPGIYEVGFGGVRIEDCVLVTKNGGVIL
jgi:Xaa-Pro dipeptidase